MITKSKSWILLAALIPLSQQAAPAPEIWRFTTSESILASPALGKDGTIYVGSYDRKLHAITPAGGDKWAFTLPSAGFTGIYSSPAIGLDGTVYFGAEDGSVYALNPTNGNMKWSFPAGDAVYSDPAIGPDGAIYIGSYSTPHSYLYAINTNGTQRWRYEPAGPIFSDPVIGPDGTVYFGCDDQKLYAITNGALRWTFPVGGAITASPALGADGTIYIGATGSKKMFAVNPDGSKAWEYVTGGSINSSAAIGSDGTIYFGSNDGYLYALNTNGTLKWSAPAGGAIRSSPAIATDGTIYVGCDDGNLYAFASGTNLWSFTASNKVFSSPAIGPDGTVYVGSDDGNLYAVTGSSALMSASWPMFRHDIQHTARYTVVTNTPPAITSITNQTMNEDEILGPIAFNITDAETPAVSLTTTVTSSNTTLLPNARIQITGNTVQRFVTVAPATNQFGTTAITLIVSDGNATNSTSFLLTVNPVNDPPVLAPLSDAVLDEGATLTMTNVVADVDEPAGGLRFGLASAPEGAAIDAVTGVFTWTPGESQGPGTNFVSVYVFDHGAPSLSATQSFTVIVREVNRAPVLSPIANRVVHQGSQISLMLSATDDDRPANTLSFSLSNAPAGALVNPATGAFSWTPGPDYVNTTNSITVFVSDDGNPPLSASNTFTITVVSRPIIRSIAWLSNRIEVSASSIPGASYALAFKTNLDEVRWIQMPAEQQAAGPDVILSDAPPLAPRRFYKVVALP